MQNFYRHILAIIVHTGAVNVLQMNKKNYISAMDGIEGGGEPILLNLLRLPIQSYNGRDYVGWINIVLHDM